MANMLVAHLTQDKGFRIGELYWLATCNDGDKVPDPFEEALDDILCDCPTLFGALPGWVEEISDLLEWLVDNRKFGFLARVEVPKPLAVHDNGYSTGGWGVYRIMWVYAESLDEMLEKAEEAAENYREQVLKELRENQ